MGTNARAFPVGNDAVAMERIQPGPVDVRFGKSITTACYFANASILTIGNAEPDPLTTQHLNYRVLGRA
jgi:hypothetical protein